MLDSMIVTIGYKIYVHRLLPIVLCYQSISVIKNSLNCNLFAVRIDALTVRWRAPSFRKRSPNNRIHDRKDQKYSDPAEKAIR